MRDQALEIERKALQELAEVKDLPGLEKFRVAYLAKKGVLTSLMKRLGELSPAERPEAGQLLNKLKGTLTERFEEARERILSRTVEDASFLDVTLPGREPARGHLHPLTQVLKEICQIFGKMGFRVVKGPNVELDYYNFEALNIPRDHPARDMQDTFYVSENVVLRTHTSPMQVRTMEKQAPPVSVIAPARSTGETPMSLTPPCSIRSKACSWTKESPSGI